MERFEFFRVICLAYADAITFSQDDQDLIFVLCCTISFSILDIFFYKERLIHIKFYLQYLIKILLIIFVLKTP